MSLREINPLEAERLGWMGAVFESVSDLVFIADLSDKIIYANPAALKRLGYTREEIIGETAEIFISPKNPRGFREMVIQKTLSSPDYGWQGEAVNRAKDGTEFLVHVQTSLVRNKQGIPIGMTGISRDISGELRAKKELEQHAKKLEEVNQMLHQTQEQLVRTEKMAAIGVLAAGIAHEVGNPLASISSLAQLLQRKTKEAKNLSALSSMQEHIQRISTIIRKVSDFAKEEQSHLMAVDLESVIRTAVQKICLQRNDKLVEIQTKFDRDLSRIKGEALQLSQVFSNVLNNAWDAMDNHGKVQIVVDAMMKNYVRVTIEDNGKGIPKEIQKKIFEPFFTTKDVGKGAGLGLAVAYGILKSFGGDLRVESVPNEGTKFHMYLLKYQ